MTSNSRSLAGVVGRATQDTAEDRPELLVPTGVNAGTLDLPHFQGPEAGCPAVGTGQASHPEVLNSDSKQPSSGINAVGVASSRPLQHELLPEEVEARRREALEEQGLDPDVVDAEPAD